MTKPKPKKDGKPKGKAKAAIEKPPAPDARWPDEDPASFPLHNVKQERFCQNVASGMPLHDAYTDAGYRGTPGNARRLRADEAVWERIEYLQREVGRMVVAMTAERITALGYGKEEAFAEAGKVLALALAMGQTGPAGQAVKLRAEIAGVPLGQTTAPPAPGETVEARSTADPAVIRQIEAHKRAGKLVVVAGTDTKKGKTG